MVMRNQRITSLGGLYRLFSKGYLEAAAQKQTTKIGLGTTRASDGNDRSRAQRVPESTTSPAGATSARRIREQTCPVYNRVSRHLNK